MIYQNTDKMKASPEIYLRLTVTPRLASYSYASSRWPGAVVAYLSRIQGQGEAYAEQKKFLKQDNLEKEFLEPNQMQNIAGGSVGT